MDIRRTLEDLGKSISLLEKKLKYVGKKCMSLYPSDSEHHSGFKRAKLIVKILKGEHLNTEEKDLQMETGIPFLLCLFENGTKTLYETINSIIMSASMWLDERLMEYNILKRGFGNVRELFLARKYHPESPYIQDVSQMYGTGPMRLRREIKIR